jgi:hypothetical protein
MAITVGSSVLSLKPKPIMMKARCELPRIWYGIWRFNSDGAEDYSGQTRG